MTANASEVLGARMTDLDAGLAAVGANGGGDPISWLHILLLALIQGATEWLPVSSSAHLILLPKVTEWPDQGPLADAMAHLGSLFAVLVYFRRDVGQAVWGGLKLVATRRADTAETKLALLLIIGTVPALLTGAAFALSGLDEAVRSPAVIAAATIGFGVLLWAGDRFGATTKTTETITVRDASLIGLVQAFAFIPGASRSGVTMTAARALGMGRREAARFSMLLGAPILAVAGLYALVELAQGAPTNAEYAQVSLTAGLAIAGLSFLAAWASIAALMALVERTGFLPFVLYRFALGAALFWAF